MKMAVFASLLLLAAAIPASIAVPVTYSVYDVGPGGVCQGRFTLDLGTALGVYDAVAFSGTIGNQPWARVYFDAQAGGSPYLWIRLGQASGDTMGSGWQGPWRIHPGSSAQLEWERLLPGIGDGTIKRLPAVPDQGPSTVLTAALFGCLCAGAAWRRTRAEALS